MTPQQAERTIYRDPVTDHVVWRITNSPYADTHAYYDVNPYSPDQHHILFSSALPRDITIPLKDNLSTPKGVIHVLDTRTWTRRLLAKDALYASHTGAFAIWHPSGQSVLFRHASGKVAIVDLDTLATRLVEGDIRQLSPDGNTIVWPNNDPDYAQGRGIYRVNTDGSGRRMIASAQEIYDLTPQEVAFDQADMFLQNTKWSVDGTRILLATRVPANPAKGYDKIKHIYIIGADGSVKRWLTDYGHHHSWSSNGSAILYCDWLHHPPLGECRAPRLFLIDADGSNKRVVIDQPLGGHPLMSPDGRHIVTWDTRGIILVDIGEQTTQYLTTFGDGFDMSHRGTHPHAVWRQDGRQILYNSAQIGRSQIYVMPFDA